MKIVLQILFMILLVSQTVSPQWMIRNPSTGIKDLLPTVGTNPFSSKSGNIGVRAGVGTDINLGFGMAFNGGFDVRAETPVIFILGPPGGASSIIPTFIATIGYHF